MDWSFSLSHSRLEWFVREWKTTFKNKTIKIFLDLTKMWKAFSHAVNTKPPLLCYVKNLSILHPTKFRVYVIIL